MLSDQARAFGLDLWKGYVVNPPQFVYDLFRVEGQPPEIEPYQAEYMMAIANGHDATWRSGHGVGKTTTLAWLVFWFICTRPFSKVPTTAPTFRQVKDVLWAEIAIWYQRFRLRRELILQTTKMMVRQRPKEWFAIGVASNRQSNIEGFHAPYILFIVDEAKGVADTIYDAIDGALTTGGQRAYASTPGSAIGRFYESHFGRLSKFFRAFHTSGEDSRRVSRTWLDQKREEWGEDSPIFQAKVGGNFPQEGDDIVIPIRLVDAAEDAFLERVCAVCRKPEDAECQHNKLVDAVPHGPRLAVGVDVARFGFNQSVAAVGSVHRLSRIDAWTKSELDITANRAFAIFKAEGAHVIGVDDTGVGGGVTVLLRKERWQGSQVPVRAINFANKSSQPDYYGNIKAEMAAKLRSVLSENLNARIAGQAGTYAMLKHDRLKGQLTQLRWREASKGRRILLDPDDPNIPATEIPKGLRVSPDHAHAHLICYHTASVAGDVPAGQFLPPEPARERGRALEQHRRRMTGYIFSGARRTAVQDEGEGEDEE